MTSARIARAPDVTPGYDDHATKQAPQAPVNIGRKPDFLLIGAQKAGTSWLWKMLDLHPGTSLPETKEIHYFGSIELHARGPEWYYPRFADMDPGRMTGEASPTYLFDRMPYWYNESSKLAFDSSLPPLPEIVHQEIPDAKIIAVLRDPVRRAISAYHHWLRKGEVSPLIGLERTATEHPKLRIIEAGCYGRHLRAWRDAYPDEQILVLIYEDDIVADPEAGLHKTYRHIGLDADFIPRQAHTRIYRSWTWTRSLARYYLPPLRRRIGGGRLGTLMDRYPLLERFSISNSDIRFLQDAYRPLHEELTTLLGNDLQSWDYGEGIKR